MQVRAGRTAGGADQADHIALPDPLARADRDPGQVGIARLYSAAVIDRDQQPIARRPARPRYCPGGGGQNPRACRTGQIDPGVEPHRAQDRMDSITISASYSTAPRAASR